MKPLESRMTEDQLEDHRLEIENRLRNLFWTVTGDYAAEFQPDVETYSNAPELACISPSDRERWRSIWMWSS